MLQVLANDFKRQWQDTESAVLSAVTAVGTSGWYILGKEVEEFERALAAFWGAPEAVGVASGLDAIELSLRAAGCKAGDKVLTTPLSAFATTLAIIKIGAIPVFVDCDDFGLVDLQEATCAFQSRPDIRTFVPVHLYGQPLDLNRLAELRDAFDLLIVEDCAQSIGAYFEGRPSGSVGLFAATSFYPTKNLGALGDGGAVLTSSDQGAATIRKLRDYGQSAKYSHTMIGYNSRLDEFHAAILRRVYLPRLPHWTERRRAIANLYRDGIANPNIRPMPIAAGSSSCYHLFPVIVENGEKESFVAHMRQCGIGVAEHYPLAIIDQPALAGVPHEILGDCAHARRICRLEVSLPIHPYLTDDEIVRVMAACNSWQ